MGRTIPQDAESPALAGAIAWPASGVAAKTGRRSACWFSVADDAAGAARSQAARPAITLFASRLVGFVQKIPGIACPQVGPLSTRPGCLAAIVIVQVFGEAVFNLVENRPAEPGG